MPAEHQAKYEEALEGKMRLGSRQYRQNYGTFPRLTWKLIEGPMYVCLYNISRYIYIYIICFCIEDSRPIRGPSPLSCEFGGVY